ncbi:ankyrin repeat domain-containing protein [bacterium]|nr:MAG: ankyrin repeat domain-containing protein [bacterium]
MNKKIFLLLLAFLSCTSHAILATTTPLHLAAHQGHASHIVKLLRHGALINAQDYAQRTPLHEAARQGHMLCVEKLLENGAMIDIQDIDEQAPLHLAAMQGRTSIVIKLLEHQANVDACGTYFAWTALHHAANKGQYECVKALVERGATIDSKNSCGETPHDIAEEKGYRLITQYLHKQAQQRLNHNASTN